VSETLEAPAVEAEVTAPEPAAPPSLRDLLTAEYDRQVAGEEPTESQASRDDKGRFAKAEADAPTEPKTPDADPAQPVSDAIERPEAWSEAEWTNLNPDVQRAIARREKDMGAALVERATDTQEVESYRQVIKPHVERFAAHGLNPQQGIERLLQWEKALSTNPQQAVAQLAQLYGVNLHSLTPDPNDPSAQPGVVQVRDPRVDTLFAERAREKAEAEQRQAATIDAQIAAFKSDSRNVHFDQVRLVMAGMMQADGKLSLQDAYDRAVWADPALRAQQQEAASKAQEAERKAKDAERVRAAKRAAVSVRDNPGSGQINGTVAKAPNLRAALEAVWDEASS